MRKLALLSMLVPVIALGACGDDGGGGGDNVTIESVSKCLEQTAKKDHLGDYVTVPASGGLGSTAVYVYGSEDEATKKEPEVKKVLGVTGGKQERQGSAILIYSSLSSPDRKKIEDCL